MAKINIQITQETGIYENEKIAEIDICNGNWKYWDNMMETTEKQSLTINNIYDAKVLNQPVKDAIEYYDHKEWEENRKLIQTSASVRTYETLLGFLNCRINNAKEWNKKFSDDTEFKYTAVLFEEIYVKSTEESVVKPMEYKVDGLITVKITMVE